MTNIDGPSGPHSASPSGARPAGSRRNFTIRQRAESSKQAVSDAIPTNINQKASALGEQAKGFLEKGASTIAEYTPQSFKNHLADLGAKIPTKKAMYETAQSGMAAIRQKLSTTPGSAQLKAMTGFGTKIGEKASHAGKQFLDKDMVKKARSFVADKASVLSQKAPIQKAKAKTDAFSEKMMGSFRGALEDMKSGKGKERMTGAYQSAKASGSKKFNELSSQALDMVEMFQGAKAKSYTKLGEAADAAKKGAGGISNQFASLMASSKGQRAAGMFQGTKAASSAKLGDAVTAAKKGAEKLAGSKAGKAGSEALHKVATRGAAKKSANKLSQLLGKAAFIAAKAAAK